MDNKIIYLQLCFKILFNIFKQFGYKNTIDSLRVYFFYRFFNVASLIPQQQDIHLPITDSHGLSPKFHYICSYFFYKSLPFTRFSPQLASIYSYFLKNLFHSLVLLPFVRIFLWITSSLVIKLSSRSFVHIFFKIAFIVSYFTSVPFPFARIFL